MIDQPEQLAVIIAPARVFCASHGEHLRAKWPQGWVMVSVKMFRYATQSDKLIHEIDPSWNGQGKAKFDSDKLNEITEHRPFCYFCTREQIRTAFQESGILTVVRCDLCGRSSIGGPYEISAVKGIISLKACLECALDAGEREHRERPKGTRISAR